MTASRTVTQPLAQHLRSENAPAISQAVWGITPTVSEHSACVHITLILLNNGPQSTRVVAMVVIHEINL